MSRKRPPREMNDTADSSYRAEDALRVLNAEPGFDMAGRGLAYVAERPLPGSTYAKAQAAPTADYPDEESTAPR